MIRNSKIHKVVKAILKLPVIPRDEEFSITRRSRILLNKFYLILVKADKKNDKEILLFMGSELRRYRGEQGEEWLWYQRPTLKRVLALNDGPDDVNGISDQKLIAAERVAKE
jgi:hypothetical protein